MADAITAARWVRMGYLGRASSEALACERVLGATSSRCNAEIDIDDRLPAGWDVKIICCDETQPARPK